MGGLLGGLYATGHSAADLERIIREANWSDLLRTTSRFEDRSVAEKQEWNRIAGQYSIQFGKGFALPAGLNSGRALDTFRSMVEAHGGNPGVAEDYSLMPQTTDREVFRAPATGFVTALRAEALGRASNVLGAGRHKVGDPVDHAVGLLVKVGLGTHVSAGEPLIELHHRGGRGLQPAMELCRAAVTISDEPPPAREKVLGEVR